MGKETEERRGHLHEAAASMLSTLPCCLPGGREGGEGWGWGHPPQGNVENNGEGQEDHGDSTACLGDAGEGLHGGPVQDGPLWMTRMT